MTPAELYRRYTVAAPVRGIVEKVVAGERIDADDALRLYELPDVTLLGALANLVRERKHGHHTFFNRNFHIEPTNICVFTCAFCSFARRPKEEGGWEMSLEQIEQIVRGYDGQPVTEVHIVGGVHPKRDVHYYGEMIRRIKQIRPELHVKAFTAVELEVMARRAKMDMRTALSTLRAYGLDSIPGGGAEIFHPDIRSQICDTKATADKWLSTHRTAHELGIRSNATMLYGHIERYEHRVDHMLRLRDLQDETGGFQTFIPLKFKHQNNDLEHLGEVSMLEDLKNYAVARIFLDNFDHVKAYWPMIGRHTTQMSLSFGVDDVDGTIDDSTKIYSMAGAEDQHPTMSTAELVQLIRSAGRTPVERDTLYNVVKVYGESEPAEGDGQMLSLPVL